MKPSFSSLSFHSAKLRSRRSSRSLSSSSGVRRGLGRMRPLLMPSTILCTRIASHLDGRNRRFGKLVSAFIDVLIGSTLLKYGT